MLSLSSACWLVKATIQLVVLMGLLDVLSHCFRKAQCYLWREHGWQTAVVFCLLASGMQPTAFAPENLTQICVCTKGSKGLIIFWELYYLSFANQVILQTEKNVVCDPAKAAAQWGWPQARNAEPCPQAWACPESELTESSSLSVPCTRLSPLRLCSSWKSYQRQCLLQPFWRVVALRIRQPVSSDRNRHNRIQPGLDVLWLAVFQYAFPSVSWQLPHLSLLGGGCRSAFQQKVGNFNIGFFFFPNNCFVDMFTWLRFLLKSPKALENKWQRAQGVVPFILQDCVLWDSFSVHKKGTDWAA